MRSLRVETRIGGLRAKGAAEVVRRRSHNDWPSRSPDEGAILNLCYAELAPSTPHRKRQRDLLRRDLLDDP